MYPIKINKSQNYTFIIYNDEVGNELVIEDIKVAKLRVSLIKYLKREVLNKTKFLESNKITGDGFVYVCM